MPVALLAITHRFLSEADELLRVLHDRDQQTFIRGSGHQAQSQASEAQMTFEICEAISTFPLIAVTARFLEPFDSDYDDSKRPMTCEVGERTI